MAQIEIGNYDSFYEMGKQFSPEEVAMKIYCGMHFPFFD